jgi:hypothetical protein
MWFKAYNNKPVGDISYLSHNSQEGISAPGEQHVLEIHPYIHTDTHTHSVTDTHTYTHTA